MRKVIFVVALTIAATSPQVLYAQGIWGKIENALNKANEVLGGQAAPKNDHGAAAETVSDHGMPQYDIHQFDIAGVRLGMTYEDAEEAVLKAGYPDIWADKLVDTFEQLVRDDVSSRTGARSNDPRDQALGGTIGSALPSGESLSVAFAATPEGLRVSEVTFIIDQDRMDPRTFEGLALKKYGQESYGHAGQLEHVWCSIGEESCRVLTYKKDANLKASTFVQNSLTLSEGTRFWERLDKARADELDLRAPKAKRAAF